MSCSSTNYYTSPSPSRFTLEPYCCLSSSESSSMPMDSNEENENVVNVEVEKDNDREKRATEEGEKEDALSPRSRERRHRLFGKSL
ncbi:hypothetical protein COLO4_24506 [Corchorus olitorius]|uniref:Uncharacterized protein n=1 Tax=Corchorus olitorius TaxID=93759 RepID=A0A1R3I997_9ROSI|nr:hypothetical protein COLO4_24506 [Corchorus olitorius]